MTKAESSGEKVARKPLLLNEVRAEKLRLTMNRLADITVQILRNPMGLMGVVILAVFTLQVTAIKGNASARGVTENYLSGMDKVEELMARPFDDPLLDAGGPYTLAADADGIDNDGAGTVDEAGETGYISVQWQVQDNVMWGQTVKLVTVTVNSM